MKHSTGLLDKFLFFLRDNELSLSFRFKSSYLSSLLLLLDETFKKSTFLRMVLKLSYSSSKTLSFFFSLVLIKSLRSLKWSNYFLILENFYFFELVVTLFAGRFSLSVFSSSFFRNSSKGAFETNPPKEWQIFLNLLILFYLIHLTHWHMLWQK